MMTLLMLLLVLAALLLSHYKQMIALTVHKATKDHVSTVVVVILYAAIYTGLAVLLLAVILFIWFVTLELLGLSDGQDAFSGVKNSSVIKKLVKFRWRKLRYQ
jgi:hypothetical protein